MAYAPFLPSQMITRNWSRWDSDITRQSQVDSVILSKNLPGGGFGRRLEFCPQCKPSSTSTIFNPQIYMADFGPLNKDF